MKLFRLTRFQAAAAAGAVALALAGGALAAGPASASTAKDHPAIAPVAAPASGPDYPSPRCQDSPYYYCLWYSPSSGGSMWGSNWQHNADIEYSNTYKFFTPGAGEGQYVRNNAASFASGWPYCVTVYYSPNYQGPSQTVGGDQGASLNPALRDNDASIQTNFSC